MGVPSSIVFLKIGSRKGRLFIEAFLRSIVPDDLAGFLDFHVQIKLCGNYPGRHFQVKVSGAGKTRKLNGRRAGYDNHCLEIWLGSGLIQERNIRDQPFRRIRRPGGQGLPAFPDSRMEDFLQSLPFIPVGKNDSPDFVPVQIPLRRKCTLPELTANLGSYAGIMH